MLFVFDLDGTLIDSAQDLATSMNATREFAGMTPLDPSIIYSYVGNGASVLVRRALGPGASDELVGNALAFFLKFYREHALEHTRLYAGVQDLLEALTQAGHQQAVLTNKPERISRDILRALHVDQHFLRILGGDSLRTKKPDPMGLLTLMQEAGLPPSQVVMVGDSGVDIETAHNAGTRSCGVSWGFQPEPMLAAKPDVVIDQPLDLLQSFTAFA